MINDAIATTLPELRAHAESRMLSTATVRRRTGRLVQDEGTGLEVPEWADVHVDLPCRIAGAPRDSARSRTVSIPGGEVALSVRVGHFPIATTGIRDGDLVEVTVGENAGLVFRVIEADSADQKTALRLPLVAVQRPSEWG